MKTLLFTLISPFFCAVAFAQTNPYDEHLLAGDSLFNIKQFKKAGFEYAAAFNSFGGKGRTDHRYKAAQTWALAGMIDSALLNLEKIVNAGYFSD